jgi:hypothetical protein
MQIETTTMGRQFKNKLREDHKIESIPKLFNNKVPKIASIRTAVCMPATTALSSSFTVSETQSRWSVFLSGNCSKTSEPSGGDERSST